MSVVGHIAARKANGAGCPQLEKADNGRWKGNAGYDPKRSKAGATLRTAASPLT